MPEPLVIVINMNVTNNFNTQTQQTEKLTHKITVCVTEDDYLRHAMLSAEGKANAKSAYVREIRREHHLHTFDPDNPPPLNINNEA